MPLCCFMIIFDELMREKCDNLRLGMQVLGTQDNAYWASWVFTAAALNAFMAIEMIFLGKYWYQFDVFTRSPAWVFFGLIYVTNTAYTSMAFFFSTVINTKTQAFTITFCVILCSMVMNIILSEPTILKKVFFNED